MISPQIVRGFRYPEGGWVSFGGHPGGRDGKEGAPGAAGEAAEKFTAEPGNVSGGGCGGGEKCVAGLQSSPAILESGVGGLLAGGGGALVFRPGQVLDGFLEFLFEALFGPGQIFGQGGAVGGWLWKAAGIHSGEGDGFGPAGNGAVRPGMALDVPTAGVVELTEFAPAAESGLPGGFFPAEEAGTDEKQRGETGLLQEGVGDLEGVERAVVEGQHQIPFSGRGFAAEDGEEVVAAECAVVVAGEKVHIRGEEGWVHQVVAEDGKAARGEAGVDGPDESGEGTVEQAQEFSAVFPPEALKGFHLRDSR